jgi:hypothetical protein
MQTYNDFIILSTSSFHWKANCFSFEINLVHSNLSLIYKRKFVIMHLKFNLLKF